MLTSEERYEKLDENTMKIITTTLDSKEDFLTLNDLASRKTDLVAQREVLEQSHLNALAVLNSKIEAIDKWILEAESLGIQIKTE